MAHPDRPQPAVKTGSERIGEDCQRGPPLAADELDSGREEGTPYPGADDRWFDKEKGQVEFLPSPTGRNRVNPEKKFARALGYEKKTLRDHRFGDCESCCHLRHELGVIAPISLGAATKCGPPLRLAGPRGPDIQRLNSGILTER